MQHELFYSKLRPSVEGYSILEIIRNSYSGDNPHHAATMEMIFERSIREYREKAAAGVKEARTQPPPTKPTATDEKSAVAEPTVTSEKPATAKPKVTEKPTTAKPKPVKSEKKQAPPPELARGSEDFLNILRSFHAAQTMTSPPKGR